MAGWLHTEISVRHRELNLDTVAHLSTNGARHRLTSYAARGIMILGLLSGCPSVRGPLSARQHLFRMPRYLFTYGGGAFSRDLGTLIYSSRECALVTRLVKVNGSKVMVIARYPLTYGRPLSM